MKADRTKLCLGLSLLIGAVCLVGSGLSAWSIGSLLDASVTATSISYSVRFYASYEDENPYRVIEGLDPNSGFDVAYEALSAPWKLFTGWSLSRDNAPALHSDALTLTPAQLISLNGNAIPEEKTFDLYGCFAELPSDKTLFVIDCRQDGTGIKYQYVAPRAVFSCFDLRPEVVSGKLVETYTFSSSASAPYIDPAPLRTKGQGSHNDDPLTLEQNDMLNLTGQGGKAIALTAHYVSEAE